MGVTPAPDVRPCQMQDWDLFKILMFFTVFLFCFSIHIGKIPHYSYLLEFFRYMTLCIYDFASVIYLVQDQIHNLCRAWNISSVSLKRDLSNLSACVVAWKVCCRLRFDRFALKRISLQCGHSFESRSSPCMSDSGPNRVGIGHECRLP